MATSTYSRVLKPVRIKSRTLIPIIKSFTDLQMTSWQTHNHCAVFRITSSSVTKTSLSCCHMDQNRFLYLLFHYCTSCWHFVWTERNQFSLDLYLLQVHVALHAQNLIISNNSVQLETWFECKIRYQIMAIKFVNDVIVLPAYLFFPETLSLIIPHTHFVFTLSVCPSGCYSHPSVTFWFFSILKRQWWNFINFGKHIDIHKMNIYNRKIRTRGQFC